MCLDARFPRALGIGPGRVAHPEIQAGLLTDHRVPLDAAPRGQHLRAEPSLDGVEPPCHVLFAYVSPNINRSPHQIGLHELGHSRRLTRIEVVERNDDIRMLLPHLRHVPAGPQLFGVEHDDISPAALDHLEVVDAKREQVAAGQQQRALLDGRQQILEVLVVQEVRALVQIPVMRNHGTQWNGQQRYGSPCRGGLPPPPRGEPRGHLDGFESPCPNR